MFDLPTPPFPLVIAIDRARNRGWIAMVLFARTGGDDKVILIVAASVMVRRVLAWSDIWLMDFYTASLIVPIEIIRTFDETSACAITERTGKNRSVSFHR
jgi:hypothetical protein